MYQLEFHLPICLFGTVIEITYHTNRHHTTKLESQTNSAIKKECKSTYNTSRHILDMNYKIGTHVLLRNYKRNRNLILTIHQKSL